MSFDNLARTLGLLPENELTNTIFVQFVKLFFLSLLSFLTAIVIDKMTSASCCFLWKLDRITQLKNNDSLEDITPILDSLEDITPILLYNSAVDGFSNFIFHDLCDNRGATMTVFTLNGTIVVGMLFKSWDISDGGWKTDPDLKLFLLNPDGSIVNLEPTDEKRKQQYYSGFLSGPHFIGLPVDLRFPKTEVHFWQRKLITGNERCNHASIDHIAVYSLDLKNFILTNSMKEQVFYRFIQSKLQKMNAASLLVSTIKRNHDIQYLQKLKAGSIIKSMFLRMDGRKKCQMLIRKNAASLLVSTIKRNHDIQYLQKLKAGSIIKSMFLRMDGRKKCQMLIRKNAASLLVSKIKRNHAIQYLQKLKAGSIIKSMFLRMDGRKKCQMLIRKNAASLLVSKIKRNHAIQALEKLKAGSIIKSMFLRIKSTNILKKLIAFDKEKQVVDCGVCLEPLVSKTLKILPCGHVICDVCFPKIILLGKCPHCRQIFQFAQCKNGEQIVSHFSGPGIKAVFFYNPNPKSSAKIPSRVFHKFPSKQHRVKQSCPDFSTMETKLCTHRDQVIQQTCIKHNYNLKSFSLVF